MKIRFHGEKTSQSEQRHAVVAKKGGKWQWYLLTLIIVSPMLYFFFQVSHDFFVIDAKGMVVTDVFVVRAPYDGYVGQITVKTGHAVRSHQALTTIISPQINNDIQNLREELLALQRLKLSTPNEELTSLLNATRNAKRHLKENLSALHHMTQLYRKKLVTVDRLHVERVRVQNAEIQLRSLRTQMSQSKERHHLAMENLYGTQIRLKEKQLKENLSEKEKLTVRTPYQGQLVGLEVQPGEYVTRGQKLMTTITNGPWRIRAFLPARYMKKSQKGHRVSVLFPDGDKLKGHVTQKVSVSRKDKASLLSGKQQGVLVVRIQTFKSLPPSYRIYQLPVHVRF